MCGWGRDDKELPWGGHTEGWSVSGTCRSGSKARRWLRGLFQGPCSGSQTGQDRLFNVRSMVSKGEGDGGQAV